MSNPGSSLLRALERDMSGRVIPPRGAQTTIPRYVSVPPVRLVPNEQATEFSWSGYALLGAGGAAFAALTDPSTGVAFAQRVDPLQRGRIDSMLIYCPDMVAAAAPYLFVQLAANGSPAPAWGFVPVYPRTGVASLAFETMIDLAPGQLVGLLAENTDVANAHFCAIYLHGWTWAKDLVES